MVFLRIWKQEEAIALTWLDIDIWLSIMILKLLGWLDEVGVGSSSDNHQSEDQSIVSFLKSITPVLSELS